MNLETPPLPVNRKWLVAVAVAILALFVLSLVLMGEIIEKPRKEQEIQKKIDVLETQIARKEQNDKVQAEAEAQAANQFDPEAAASAGNDERKVDAHFLQQEERLKTGTINENRYLEERIWGFWYIVLPLIIAAVIFILWVRKKHKSWTR